MFEKKAAPSVSEKTNATDALCAQTVEEAEETYAEMKIGKVVQLVMRPILESGNLSDTEVMQLQSKAYCNELKLPTCDYVKKVKQISDLYAIPVQN